MPTVGSQGGAVSDERGTPGIIIILRMRQRNVGGIRVQAPAPRKLGPRAWWVHAHVFTRRLSTTALRHTLAPAAAPYRQFRSGTRSSSGARSRE